MRFLALETNVRKLKSQFIAAGEATSHATSPARADVGTGSALLDRLAARLGWRVVFASPAQVSILFAGA